MILRVADASEHCSILHELLIQAELLINRLEKRYLVVIVVDSEPPREASSDVSQRITIAPQDTNAKRVKRRNHRRTYRFGFSQQIDDTLAHLVGSLIRECNGQDGRPGNIVRGNQVRHAVSNHPCFPAASARQQ